MKIVVTYEKRDILRLIEAAIKAQGLHVKEGTHIDFKGPLSAKFEIETEDETILTPPTPAPTVSPPVTPVSSAPSEFEDDTDMSEVLQISKGLVKTSPAPERSLRDGESYEYPRK
jgi:hypothetical protein